MIAIARLVSTATAAFLVHACVVTDDPCEKCHRGCDWESPNCDDKCEKSEACEGRDGGGTVDEDAGSC